jgi:transcriptional regulator with XRE-family HTH domain
LDVKPQYISKLLKGEENFTLETIPKLSTALGIELISFPAYKYSKPVDESTESFNFEFQVNEE